VGQPEIGQASARVRMDGRRMADPEGRHQSRSCDIQAPRIRIDEIPKQQATFRE